MVFGPSEMKKEIFARGPIVCGMQVTSRFETYKGGIYSQRVIFPTVNHAISVVGWGKEKGVEFWVVRNSWGTRFGEEGYFRIVINGGNLGIGATPCYWGISERT